MLRLAATLLFILLIAACSATEPTWRARVAPVVEELGKQDAASLLPQDYRSLLETFEHGEAIFHVHEDDEQADNFYKMAFQKAELLRSELRILKQRKAEEERQLALELAQKAEEERLMREAADAELRLLEQEKIQSAASVEVEIKVAAPPVKNITKESVKHLPATYTVRRGETLPQIAGRNEIFNDSSLWPVIYRANRDQISDPKRLWPGQVLIIPRHFSRDDAVGVKRSPVKK